MTITHFTNRRDTERGLGVEPGSGEREGVRERERERERGGGGRIVVTEQN